MERKIVFATSNSGKIREIQRIMADAGVEIITMKEAGVELDIEENGQTYEENALIKARAVASCVDSIVMADDSGLEIDYLNNEPGIYSARYLGEDVPQKEKNIDLLKRLADIPWEQRTARFVCTIAAVLPNGEELVMRATMDGYIDYEERGDKGFGYDPIFYVPQFAKTAAQLTETQKDETSHRGKALRLMKDRLHERGIIPRKDDCDE